MVALGVRECQFSSFPERSVIWMRIAYLARWRCSHRSQLPQSLIKKVEHRSIVSFLLLARRRREIESRQRQVTLQFDRRRIRKAFRHDDRRSPQRIIPISRQQKDAPVCDDAPQIAGRRSIEFSKRINPQTPELETLQRATVR